MPISAKKISNNSRTEASGLGKHCEDVLPAVHVECREKNTDAGHNTSTKMTAEARWESVDLLALCFNHVATVRGHSYELRHVCSSLCVKLQSEVQETGLTDGRSQPDARLFSSATGVPCRSGAWGRAPKSFGLGEWL